MRSTVVLLVLLCIPFAARADDRAPNSPDVPRPDIRFGRSPLLCDSAVAEDCFRFLIGRSELDGIVAPEREPCAAGAKKPDCDLRAR